MSEILALKGQLQSLKEKKRNLEAQAAIQIRGARAVLDPFLKPVTKMKDGEAAVAVNALQSVLASLRATDAEIIELEDALGQ